MRLHHVQLAMPAGGESRAEAFWSGLLGLARVAKPETLAGRGGAWFRGETVEIHVGIEEPFRPAGKAHPALLIDDLDAMAARLSDAGHEVRWDEAFPNLRRFYTDDPFGNRIEIMGT